MKGETADLTIVIPCGDDSELSNALRKLTQAIDFIGAADGHAGGLFGGEWGYGANYENDVFMLHRYCWCEEDDCLWCGGSTCRAEIERAPHSQTCYQTRLQALKERHGRRLSGSEWYVTYGNKAYERARDALCAELSVDPLNGCEAHCTCGSDAEWWRRYDACECDWHMGRGRYRFGPAVGAPNFWHKASGAQVRWYKYIGRGMERTEPDGASWEDVFRSCLASLQARRPHERAECKA